jgi:hypothetical protein
MRGAAHFRQEACLLDRPSVVQDRINEFFDRAGQE